MIMNANLDPLFLSRIRNVLEEQEVEWIEKKMFGGMCFMIDDKMCFGTYQGGLMARVGPDAIEELIKIEGAEQMIHGARPMKGYAIVEPAAFEQDDDLAFWIEKCLAFNPLAKASRKKKK